MRFLTVTVCAIVATLVAAAQVIALEETTLARRQASQSNSLVIVCPPGANTPCDQSVHVVSQTNATAAKNALDMCNAYDESQAGNHNPRVDSAGFDPRKRRSWCARIRTITVLAIIPPSPMESVSR